MRVSVVEIIHAPVVWRGLIALIVIGGRIALDGVLPRGRMLRRTSHGD
ncbi:MAG TPA: hypothetical protein VH277_07995 [Gemmatimonadaceae bacterium]|jgi:hypothetical protein|nr:hypothetical protein [Gemmatimonadaceae bacterium]